MRNIFAIVLPILLSLAFFCACTQAQVQPSAPPPAPMINPTTGATDGNAAALDPAASVDQVLDALHDVGQGLKDFTADVKLTETDNSTGDSSTRTGKVLYQLKPDGNARLRVTFDNLQQGDLIRNEKIEYKLDNGWLVDRNYKKKIEVNRQVLRPGEKVNLIKLGEGPFPLPIGQDKDDVHRLFDVKRADDDKTPGAPAGAIHIQLTPKAGTQFARKFTSIDVWVDRKSHMPVRIDTLDAAGNLVRSTELSNVRVNGGLNDGDFSLPKIDDQEWTRHDEPFTD